MQNSEDMFNVYSQQGLELHIYIAANDYHLHLLWSPTVMDDNNFSSSSNVDLTVAEETNS